MKYLALLSVVTSLLFAGTVSANDSTEFLDLRSGLINEAHMVLEGIKENINQNTYQEIELAIDSLQLVDNEELFFISLDHAYDYARDEVTAYFETVQEQEVEEKELTAQEEVAGMVGSVAMFLDDGDQKQSQELVEQVNDSKTEDELILALSQIVKMLAQLTLK